MSISPFDPTLRVLLDNVGDIPLSRIRTLSENGEEPLETIVNLEAKEDRLYELINGVLVEKVMGFLEGQIALLISQHLLAFVKKNDLGVVGGVDSPLQIREGQVRIPDISFISWTRLPNQQSPTAPIPDLVPDLAVEVISKGNTTDEMNRKLIDYFDAGVRQVWYVHPASKTVHVYDSPDDSIVLEESDTLDGSEILPGFAMPIKEIFPA